MSTMNDPSKLYAASERLEQHTLPVSALHSINVEVYGKADGVPVVFLHGGPGGGTDVADTRRFDPQTYRVVLIDQRGSGKSTPSSCLEENDTWSLVADIEKVREHLKIERWHVFGGSWGSTLSLSYAITHPNRVVALILRGIFTLRKAELDWFYGAKFNGPSYIFPEEHEKYVAQIPEEEQDDMVTAYYKRLTSEDPQVRRKAAQAWCRWEMATCHLIPSAKELDKAEEDQFADQFARIEAHYFVNKGFMQEDGWLLKKEQIDKIRHIPCTIIQGRYDLVCPYFTAYELKKAWPEADFVEIADAGHSSSERGIENALVAATDKARPQPV